jgi:hypothetical protein
MISRPAARIEFAPALMTREMAAFYISGSLREIDELRSAGRITAVGQQKRVKFRKVDLDTYVESLKSRHPFVN